MTSAAFNALPLPEAAEAWAWRGLAVFPCLPGDKKPLGTLAPHGVHDATRDIDRVRSWWRQEPRANIGCAGGDGLLLLDLDVQHNGHLSLADAETEFGAMPDSLCQWSGAVVDCPLMGPGVRSWHALYQLPDSFEHDLAGREVLPGVDVRGRSQYIVLAPSVHPSGRRYELRTDLDHEISELPGWMLVRFSSAAHGVKLDLPDPGEIGFDLPRRTAARLVGWAWDHHRPNRREALANLAYRLRHCVVTQEQALAVMRVAAAFFDAASDHREPYDSEAWITAKLATAWRQTPAPALWRLQQIVADERRRA